MSMTKQSKQVPDSELERVCLKLEQYGFYLVNPQTNQYHSDPRGALYKMDQERAAAIPSEPRYNKVVSVAEVNYRLNPLGDQPSLIDVMKKLLAEKEVPDLNELVGFTFIKAPSYVLTTNNPHDFYCL